MFVAMVVFVFDFVLLFVLKIVVREREFQIICCYNLYFFFPLAILLLILFICCVARAVFMIFCALLVRHTLQTTPSATPVALRCRHLWSIFLIWKHCISAVSFFDGAGCLLAWLFLLVILCCFFDI